MQTANSTKEQFANYPCQAQAILQAITNALALHTAMSIPALNSLRAQDRLKNTLLGPAQLYQAPRARNEPTQNSRLKTKQEAAT
jgi:type I restriction enzyme R subunit